MIIYKITNNANGKIYIGQTTKTAEQRLAKHWSEAHVPSRPNNYFHNAMLKYGIESFKIEVIDTATSMEELNQKEAMWIERLNSTDHSIGYNIMTGGKSGTKPASTRSKIGNKKRQNWQEEELASRMYAGLKKATQTWQQVCRDKRVRFICPNCGRELMITSYEAKSKNFCSRQCAIKAGCYAELAKKASEKGVEATIRRRAERDNDAKLIVNEWVANNTELIKACNANRVSSTLWELQELFVKNFNVKDWRSISLSICGKPAKKELLKYLKSECENVRCTGLN